MEFHPIQMPESTKYGSDRWLVYSPKLKRRVQLFSNLEYYNWLTIEVDPNIISFCEQPIKIFNDLSNDNVKQSFTIPDMITEDVNGNQTVIEVKYEKDLSDPRVTRQVELQKEWAANNNMNHHIFTDKILNKRLYLSSYKQIIQSVSSSNEFLLSDTVSQVIALRDLQDSITIREILTSIDDNRKNIIDSIFLLIYQGRIELLPLKDIISTDSEVIING